MVEKKRGSAGRPGTNAAPPPAVALVAHGSARSPKSAEPVLHLAEVLRRRGFPEVLTGFWKEEPFLHQMVAMVRAPELVVVPLFLAQGYFTRVVVPREIAAGRAAGPPPSVRLLPPVGAAEGLDTLVLDRALQALEGREAGTALLVVLGHGTERDPRSADTVVRTAGRLRAAGPFREVRPAFIDQEPGLAHVIGQAGAEPIVVVPFLMSSGFHGGETVPTELGRMPGDASNRVVYAQPVGTHPRFADIVEETIRDAIDSVEPWARGAGLAPPRRASGSSRNAEASSGTSALSALIARVRERGGAVLLEALVREAPEGFHLRHHADRVVPEDALRRIDRLVDLAELGRRSLDGGHRPLRSGRGLPRGWRVEGLDAAGLGDALGALYGSALADWHAGETGALPVLGFRQAARRQSGLLAAAGRATAADVTGAVTAYCHTVPCLRTPTWSPAGVPPRRPHGPSSPATDDDANRIPASWILPVPCLEPCPLLLSALCAG